MIIRVSDITFFDKTIFSNQQILFDLEQKLFKLQSFQRSTVSVPLKLKVSLFNLYCIWLTFILHLISGRKIGEV